MELVPLRERKVTLAIGIDRWTSLDRIDSAHSQISGWKGDGFDFAASYKVDQSTVYGLVQADAVKSRADQIKGTRLLALAACVALVKSIRGQNAFVAFRLHDDLVAAIGLRQGVVLLDQLVSTVSLELTRKKFEENLGGQGYAIWGDADTLPNEATPLELEEVIPSRGGPQVEPLRSSRAALIALGVGCAGILLAAAGYAWSEFQQHTSQLKLQQQLPLRDTAQAQYRRSVDQLLAKPTVPLGSALRSFRDALSTVPVYHAGWELHGATCSSSGMCTLRYQRLAGMGLTFKEFAANPEPGWDGVASSGDEEAVVSITVKVPTGRLNRTAWTAIDELQKRSRSQWQYLEPGGWKASMGSRAIQAVPPGIDPKELGSLASLPEAVFAVPVDIASQAWWYVDDDVDSPIQPAFLGEDTVMEGDLDIVVSGKDVTFSVKGLSYVR